MSDTKFDASKYLTKLGQKDYLEVKWRLLWLRTEHPDASIVTEMVERQGNFAIFKATVSIPNGGDATGWGSEDVEDFGDFIEKAETKAIGRALAALGFGTQFCEDFNEDGTVTDSPVQRQQTRPAKPQRTAPDPRTNGEPPDPQAGLGRNIGRPPPQQIAFIKRLLDDWKGGDERAACEAVQRIMPNAVNDAGTGLAIETLNQVEATKLVAGIQDARRAKQETPAT